MKKKLQIFISSTYRDLIEERQAAVSAILKAGHIPAGMELFTAGDESQMETIKRWIDESDVFMLILGGRYGSVEPTTSLSYTELEYDYAVNSGKPYFAVVIEEAALKQKVKDRGIDVFETENIKKLEVFRRKVLNRISAFYTNIDDIRLAVYESILELPKKYDFKGWVSGNEIPDIQSFTDQINKLREEKQQLVEERDALNKGEIFTASEEKDFQFIYNRLDRDIEIHLSLYRKKADGKSDEIVGEEICRVSALAAVLTYVNEGHQLFEQDSLEYELLERLRNQVPLVNAPEIKRTQGKGIKELLTLDLQAFGLIRSTTKQRFDQQAHTHEFTEKVHRFKYWLDYSGHSVKDIYIECEPRLTTTEKVEGGSQPLEQDPSIANVMQLDREIAAKERIKKWRTTEEGVIAAKREVSKVFEALQSLALKSNEVAQLIRLDFNRVSDNEATLTSGDYNLKLTWICKHDNTLEGAALFADLSKSEQNGEEQPAFAGLNPDHYGDYEANLDYKFNFYWVNKQQEEHYTSEMLAEFFFKLLLSKLRKAYANQ